MKDIVIEEATFGPQTLSVRLRVLTHPVNTYRALRVLDYGQVIEASTFYDPVTGSVGGYTPTTLDEFVASLPGQWSLEVFLAVWEGFAEGYKTGMRSVVTVPSVADPTLHLATLKQKDNGHWQVICSCGLVEIDNVPGLLRARDVLLEHENFRERHSDKLE